uniref:Uncharacterized protein n=1 Tax=Lepeophtheirus salmonis TaxID=72036 RepID=A0A0K2SY71_LEPSM
MTSLKLVTSSLLLVIILCSFTSALDTDREIHQDNFDFSSKAAEYYYTSVGSSNQVTTGFIFFGISTLLTLYGFIQ